MANLNESLKEAVCIDEEVFFGPITDKEKKIREQFENLHRKEYTKVETSKTLEDDESQSNSVYKSFSVDESKYDSFDDSLNERIDKMPQEAALVTLRKSYDKIKSKRSGFYDSLEDVCSLVSNIDKCSISHEVENESNLNSKHFVEDSLKILSVPVASKNNFINDQVHFDDDSLAILECETTFSDSLEEVNVLESIEIEEINDIENISMENQNIVLTVDQHSVCQKNLFDTSVEIVSEKKKDIDNGDQESFDDRNLLYDSLSNSDFKDILTDSLEEGKQLKEMLSSSKYGTINIAYDNENVVEMHNNELFNVEQNSILPNLFDTSVQIVSEKLADNNSVSPKESHNDNNLSDSFSNSEVKDVSKDSLEESDKLNEILNISQHNIHGNIVRSENDYEKPSIFETSVQIIYDNTLNCLQKESTNEEISNSIDNFEKYKSVLEKSDERINSKNSSYKTSVFKSPSQELSEDIKNANADKSTLLSDSSVNEGKVKTDVSIVSDHAITASGNDMSKKETFSVESCHLKILNDDKNIDKDLKFQLHIEVTVGDKKCQLASQDIKMVPVTSKDSKSSQDIKIVPVTTEHCKSENDCVSTISLSNPLSHSISNTFSQIEKEEHVLHLENKNSDSHKKLETTLTSNVTLRTKSSTSQTSCAKFHCVDSFNDVSLLQALDLSDISTSFLNESIIQSKDSLIPLNLYSPDECIQNFHISQFKNKNKENIPEHMQAFENEKFNAIRKSSSPIKVYSSKTPQSLQKSSSFKETNKKTPGTKIPVRKVDNFVVPTTTPSKFTKPFPATLSAEKVKKCHHSPHSVDSCKKTPGTTPNKIPHICKVRNTIFSKVPQIIPSKKYVNVQSPVAQYIKNNSGPLKTPGVDPVLQDCMNHLMESPHHLQGIHTGGSLKSAKKKT